MREYSFVKTPSLRREHSHVQLSEKKSRIRRTQSAQDILDIAKSAVERGRSADRSARRPKRSISAGPVMEGWKSGKVGPFVGKPDITTVGAGPVGLFTAIQIQLMRKKTKKPPLKILMAEKHAYPSSRNLLKIGPEHLKNCEQDPEGVLQGLYQALETNSRFRKTP